MILLGEYKEILGIEGNTEDEFIEQSRLEIEGKVKETLNRDLEIQDYVEVYDGANDEELVLNQYPIVSVSKLEIYGGLDGAGNEVWDEWVQGEDYERLVITSTKDRLYMIGASFPRGSQNVRITYRAGYDIIPYEIQQACKKLMLLYYGEVKKNKSLGKSSVSDGSGFSKTTSFDLQAEERILKGIEKYRVLNV